MPTLEKPRQPERVQLLPRTAIVAGTTDVLVVGGGPAGIGAALGAAEAGADVVLAERYGFLGGNATAALVMPLMSFHTHSERFEREGTTTLLPTDHGPGHSIIAGALQRLLERLVVAGGAIPPTTDTGYVVPFDPEIFKLEALNMLDEAGVRFLFHAFATDIAGRDLNDGVVFETKSGPIIIRARSIVDCTGDGDVAARAGAAFDIGRSEDGLVQPMTLMFRLVDFHREAFARYVSEHPTQWRGVHGLWDLVEEATRNRDLDLAREDILFFATPHPREVSVNSIRVTRVLGTDVWDLSYAEWESRRQLRQLALFFRKYVPGFEEAYVAQSGVNVGVRETRRIVGEYQMTADDLLNARKFHDAIAQGTYPVDIHNPKGKGTVLRNIPIGESYDIPLRSLIPKVTDGIVVAGRCISGTHEAHSSYRVMPICTATGHAAGITAALAARQDAAPRSISASRVQEELLRQGAKLSISTPG